MTDTTEQLIAATGANKAPRVTPADVEAQIAAERYFTAADGTFGADMRIDGTSQPPDDDTPLALLTICVLVLWNGFVVTGESACASPENFDADVGREVARKKAVEKIWPLLGFRLRDQLKEMSERAGREHEALKMVRGEDVFGTPEDAA